MIKPYIEHLAYGIDEKGGDQHSGGAGEDLTDGAKSPVAFRRDVQQPALAEQQKEQGGEHTDPHCPIGLLFSFTFGQNVRDQESHGKKYVSKSLFHSEGIDQNQHLDISQYRSDGRQTVQTGLAEEAVCRKRHGKDENDRACQ